MLTSLYYYEHYRPYIMKNTSPGNARTNRKEFVTEKTDAPTEVSLNKSLSSNVISYAKDIYSSTTELKHASKKLASDLKNYTKYQGREGFSQEMFEAGFKKDVEKFTGSYNKSVKFLKNQQHSKYLSEAAVKLEDMTDSSEKILSVMGIKKNEAKEFDVDLSESTFWNGKNTSKKIDAAERLFGKMYDETAELLDSPMSKHMNFKNLNYYYNYEVDSVKVDSFQIIKTGLLVNLAL